MTDRTASTARAAVVTGADSGIGRAAAVRLAEAGMDVGITWHSDEEGAERTAAEVRGHGRRAAVAQMDLSRLRLRETSYPSGGPGRVEAGGPGIGGVWSRDRQGRDRQRRPTA